MAGAPEAAHGPLEKGCTHSSCNLTPPATLTRVSLPLECPKTRASHVGGQGQRENGSFTGKSNLSPNCPSAPLGNEAHDEIWHLQIAPQ